MITGRKINKRAFILFLIVWLIGIFVVYDIRPMSILSNNWVKFTSSRYGFSIDHPQKWVAREYGEEGYKGVENLIFILSSDFDPGFNGIEIKWRSAENPTIEDVEEWGKSYITETSRNLQRRGEQGFEEISINQELINGAIIIRQNYILGNLTIEDVYIARKNSMIILTLRTSQGQFNQYKEEFDKIIMSFAPIN